MVVPLLDFCCCCGTVFGVDVPLPGALLPPGKGGFPVSCPDGGCKEEDEGAPPSPPVGFMTEGTVPPLPTEIEVVVPAVTAAVLAGRMFPPGVARGVFAAELAAEAAPEAA